MTYQPGDVVLLPFPYSDGNVSKRRPVLLLTEPDTVDDVICLAVTSSSVQTSDKLTLRNSEFPAVTPDCPSPVPAAFALPEGFEAVRRERYETERP